jgi:hypothetical protein
VTEKTVAWLPFDRDRVYVSFRCWDTVPEGIVANEMRRDNGNIFQTTWSPSSSTPSNDRRIAVFFAVKALGGRVDGRERAAVQNLKAWGPTPARLRGSSSRSTYPG